MDDIQRQLHEIKRQVEAHIEKKREEERQKKEEEVRVMLFIGNFLTFFGVAFLMMSLLYHIIDSNILSAVNYLIIGFIIGQCGINLMLMSKIKKLEWKL